MSLKTGFAQIFSCWSKNDVNDNDVTLVLVLNWISLIRIFFEYALRYLYFKCLPSAVGRISSYLGISLKRYNFYAWTEGWSWCRQICHLMDVSGKLKLLVSFFFLRNAPYTFSRPLKPSRLARFWKTWKYTNQGKTMLSPFFQFVRLLSRKRRLNENWWIDFLYTFSELQLISVVYNPWISCPLKTF